MELKEMYVCEKHYVIDFTYTEIVTIIRNIKENTENKEINETEAIIIKQIDDMLEEYNKVKVINKQEEEVG